MHSLWIIFLYPENGLNRIKTAFGEINRLSTGWKALKVKGSKKTDQRKQGKSIVSRICEYQ